jgi:hypothetical protein
VDLSVGFVRPKRPAQYRGLFGQTVQHGVVHVQTLFSLDFPDWLRLRKLASIAEKPQKWLRYKPRQALTRPAAAVVHVGLQVAQEKGRCSIRAIMSKADHLRLLVPDLF